MSVDKYEQWIKDNVCDPTGRCVEITLIMHQVFPELIRVRGHYYCDIWGEREHWWLILPSEPGGILIDYEAEVLIDPTRDQFPSRGNGKYIVFDESLPEPTGMCPNCGSYTYDGHYLCNDVCEREFMASLI